MEKKLIKLLEKQIQKLDNEDFDLEAWKSTAASALTKVFGKGNSKSKQVEALKIDYSSWMLRDSNARYKPIETCKKKGREIVQSAIEEIEVFGLPVSNEDILIKYFTKSEIEELASPNTGKKEKIIKKLKKEDLQELVLDLILYRLS